MLTEIYIEALLANEELADHVWGAWDAGDIDDLAAWAWCILAEAGIFRDRLDFDPITQAVHCSKPTCHRITVVGH